MIRSSIVSQVELSEPNRAIVFDNLDSLGLHRSQPAVYDRPIGVRLLLHDPASGATHYLVRYPAGLVVRRHRHSAAHTVIVLDGMLEANGEVIGPGSYCHFPARQAVHRAPANGESCLLLMMFHGPFDVQALIG